MSLVLRDGVAMESVTGGHHLPGQQAGAEGFVARQHKGDVPWLSTTAAIVIRYGLCDGFHFSLMAICAYGWEYV